MVEKMEDNPHFLNLLWSSAVDFHLEMNVNSKNEIVLGSPEAH